MCVRSAYFVDVSRCKNIRSNSAKSNLENFLYGMILGIY